MCVWNSLCMTAVITLPLVANRGKNYKFQKIHYSLEQDYGLKGISGVQKINVQVCMFWQGPHLVKYAWKEINKIRKMVTFLFWPFLWPLWSVFAIQLHAIFYIFGHQCARLVWVCIRINPSQLKNCLVIVDNYEKHHRMPWKKNLKWLLR